MKEDKEAVHEMNKRIMADLQRVELDRSTQIKKLIFSYAQALAENSQRVKQVFERHGKTVANIQIASGGEAKTHLSASSQHSPEFRKAHSELKINFSKQLVENSPY